MCHPAMKAGNPLEKQNFNRALKPGSRAELSQFSDLFFGLAKVSMILFQATGKTLRRV